MRTIEKIVGIVSRRKSFTRRGEAAVDFENPLVSQVQIEAVVRNFSARHCRRGAPVRGFH
jgi:hypothetical protein